ncbi:hypothetical protein JOE40_002156 [Arthrobacter sp. PvP102]|nr:hypothetical protein [Arthrobacter sp. PvP103]MBP1237647.1 hypothetical protein [Arthrobacter sp. PvP102]
MSASLFGFGCLVATNSRGPALFLPHYAAARNAYATAPSSDTAFMLICEDPINGVIETIR